MRSRLTAVLASLFCVLLAAPAHAAFPGGNGKIAFSAFRNGNMDVYTVNPDGSGQTRLTSDPEWEYDPAWSPDGSKIAYTRWIDDFGHKDVYVMDADGANKQRVWGLPQYSLGQPSWSPSGAELAMTIRISYLDIFRGRADGQGSLTAVAAPFFSHSNQAPAWSPDGTRVAYGQHDFRGAVSSYDLHVAKVDGTGDMNLTPTPNEYEMFPNWSPDGETIAIGDEVSAVGIRLYDGNGGNRTVVPGSSRDSHPAFSPDGKKLVTSTWIFEAQHSMLVTYNRDGSERTLVPGTERTGWPDWQPIPPPRRADYKNAATFCKAEREFFGDEAFRQRYGSSANAYGKCVSSN